MALFYGQSTVIAASEFRKLEAYATAIHDLLLFGQGSGDREAMTGLFYVAGFVGGCRDDAGWRGG